MGIRIGIDVGGTFTHAVAINGETLELLGKSKVPTTHHSSSGVGEGVVQSLSQVMKNCSITPESIQFVAHSTTQATNSLLEGDVETVALLSTGRGSQGRRAKKIISQLGSMQLSPGRFLRTIPFHLDLDRPDYETDFEKIIESAKNQNLRVFAVIAPFSVDDPSLEDAITQALRERGFYCTASNEVAQLYGLKIRARTTALNASIMPKMLEVAEKTESEVKKLGIKAPLMIMRSDGGVMSVQEMKRKPVLTLLSGPAAGISAALRYLRITDGIFLEVGGTSTDISVIRNGSAMMRAATIGGQRTFLKTLDCRTLGIGGGSLPRIAPEGSRRSQNPVAAVGPRSAHIAKVSYAAFSELKDQKPTVDFSAEMVQPLSGDPSDYLVLNGNQQRYSITPTCAANLLEMVTPGDCAKAHFEDWSHWSSAFEQATAKMGLGTLRSFAQAILSRCSETVGATVETLMREYRLEKSWLKLIGGGGGAQAIVPHLAKTLALPFETARDHDVISAIGVALGLLREVVEKSMVNPTQDDLLKLRSEIRQTLISQGADPESIRIQIEVDTKKNLVRCEAQGSMGYSSGSGNTRTHGEAPSREDQIALARQGLGLDAQSEIESSASTSAIDCFRFVASQPKWFGLGRTLTTPVACIDRRGVVLRRFSDVEMLTSRVSTILSDLRAALESRVVYGDGGATYPFATLLVADRVINLSKLVTLENMLLILSQEVAEVPSDEGVVLLLSNTQISDQE